MSNHRIPDPPCLRKQKIPSTRYEYQDCLPELPLTGTELRTLLYLLKCGARTGEAWPKHATIARVCRCHQDTAGRATKRLEELGLIRIVRGRTHNRYRFPWHREFIGSSAPKTSDLPPYKGNPEAEPTTAETQPAPITHNPALEIPLDEPIIRQSRIVPPAAPYFGSDPYAEYAERFRREAQRATARPSPHALDLSHTQRGDGATRAQSSRSGEIDMLEDCRNHYILYVGRPSTLTATRV